MIMPVLLQQPHAKFKEHDHVAHTCRLSLWSVGDSLVSEGRTLQSQFSKFSTKSLLLMPLLLLEDFIS